MIKANCQACGRELFHYPGRIKKYCCQSCARSGKANGNYKGESHSFIAKAKPNYRGDVIKRKYIRHEGKWVYEHRVIAEKALGRKLKKTELVHHINCDPSDNRNSNLLICDKDYHTWLHQRMGFLWAQERFADAF